MTDEPLRHRPITISRSRVVIESPFAGDVERNLTYLRRALRDSIVNHSESPFASHGLYTQPGVLNDSIEEEREIGIAMGLLWAEKAEKMILYMDYGRSFGMRRAELWAQRIGLSIEYRSIGENP